MATSVSCTSVGAAIDKLAGGSKYKEAFNSAEGSQLLHGHYKKSIKKAQEQSGHLRSSSSTILSSNQASRFASIVIAATAWAGLSMCGPIEALAMAYEGEGESVIFMSTSTVHLAGYGEHPANFLVQIGEFDEEHGKAEMEATIGKVPSIKPPNEGLNSPWVPKTNGPYKKTASMRCPKWTESELEMVLPDFQGRPKPFPRMQGHLYPFWPATASMIDKGDVSDMHERSSTLPSLPAPPSQQPIKKLPSCFTM